ncbi:hypothetical protein ACVWZL_000963 [Bradyrhizobium sp. GM2.4]
MRNDSDRGYATLLAAAMLGALIIMTAATANAELVKLQADLKGSNEVPPNNSPGTGKAEATYDTEAKTLTYTVSFAGLTGPAMGAHFHGPRGGRQERRHRAAVQDGPKPDSGERNAHRSSGCGPAGWEMVCQHSYGREPGR